MFNKVLLPQPLGPMIDTNSPGRTCRLMSLTATNEPERPLNVRATSEYSIWNFWSSDDVPPTSADDVVMDSSIIRSRFHNDPFVIGVLIEAIIGFTLVPHQQFL